MMKLWKFVALMALLSSSAFAAFIQSPIPPSSRENYLRDSDGNGRLDRVDMKFLGTLSQEYVNQMVDSLTFDWLDSAGRVKHYSVGPKQFLLDSTYSRRAYLDLRSLEGQFALLTEMVVGKDSLGGFKMFLHDGTVYDIPVKDVMAPVISETFLKSYRGKKSDTLLVVFSERVMPVYGCEAFFESKSKRDSLNHFRKPAFMIWTGEKSAQVIFENAEETDDYLLPRDSIRLTPKCFADSAAKNLSSEVALFSEVAGFYPIDVLSSNMAYSETPSSDLPIFQMLFKEEGADVPNDNSWGVAMDVLGPEFENAIRDALSLDHKKPLDLSKLKIFMNLRIYTNLGSFVVATSDEVFGDDPRFEGRPTRLFLKWNLMDGGRRRVATGAYISNAVVIVSYDGQVVFRNDIHHGPTTQVFGVKRK
ncbi:hypothetical protein BGX12_11382 [Fibrobacter sp. UWR4]|nr:hypothetical protein BGX12_11382 [Fibrobacter sp. UWR4]PZW72358.1 hypothetical protein C8E88_100789 [Fibrobacter sp. UWR1]